MVLPCSCVYCWLIPESERIDDRYPRLIGTPIGINKWVSLASRCPTAPEPAADEGSNNKQIEQSFEHVHSWCPHR
ncbi:MAG: hypothetical protein AAF959_11985 [Cyanobacteria bacterium P01_D01_bin.56]